MSVRLTKAEIDAHIAVVDKLLEVLSPESRTSWTALRGELRRPKHLDHVSERHSERIAVPALAAAVMHATAAGESAQRAIDSIETAANAFEVRNARTTGPINFDDDKTK